MRWCSLVYHHTEALNQLVKHHILIVVSAAPRRPGEVISALKSDMYKHILAGMVTSNTRLADVENEKLILRAVDLKCPEADGGRPIVRACCARIVRRECETVERAGVASRP